MGWKDLLQKPDETVTVPWIGGRAVRKGQRAWNLSGNLPEEHGWYAFSVNGRQASLAGPSDPDLDILAWIQHGYLVGDRLIPDNIFVDPDPERIISFSERVCLVEAGVGRFARASAGRAYEGGPLVYRQQEMSLGPEDEVLQAFLNREQSVDKIPGVHPSLDAAFRMESWQRSETEKRREAERQRREAEELRRREEERREDLRRRLGDGASRREMARIDFAEAARSALAIGGAELLDHRRSVSRNEMIVQFRLNRRQFECTCDANTLRIIDAGICLRNERTGEAGDTFFTLESLPAVIMEADRRGVLHVFRHVVGGPVEDEDEDW